GGREPRINPPGGTGGAVAPEMRDFLHHYTVFSPGPRRALAKKVRRPRLRGGRGPRGRLPRAVVRIGPLATPLDHMISERPLPRLEQRGFGDSQHRHNGTALVRTSNIRVA